jgi:hypothetical protein
MVANALGIISGCSVWTILPIHVRHMKNVPYVVQGREGVKRK